MQEHSEEDDDKSNDAFPLKRNFAAYKALPLSLSSLMPPRHSCEGCGDARLSLFQALRGEEAVEGPTASKGQV